MTTVNLFRSGLLRQQGFTLVELMVALVLGLAVIAGVIVLLTTSRVTTRTSQNQAALLDTGRFALHEIGRDIAIAGTYGTMTWSQAISGRETLSRAEGDCGDGFFSDINVKVAAVNQPSSGFGACINASNHKTGTDVLVVRYAKPFHAVNDDATAAGTVYVQSFLSKGQLFMGGAANVPTIYPNNNYPLVTHVYYIHNDTQASDGIPSLRRISLIKGPKMVDEVLASGVENLQIQLGINDCSVQVCEKSVNRYVDSGTGIDPDKIKTVRVWVLARAENTDKVVGEATYTMAGRQWTFNDSYRRKLFFRVFALRNAVSGGR